MKWLEIAGWNVKLAEKQDEYETIVVRKGTQYVQHGSLLVPVPNLVAEIQPEAEDLKRLNEGGSLFLNFLGESWPPAGLTTYDPALLDPNAGNA